MHLNYKLIQNRPQLGGAIVEAAIVLPVLLLIMLGIVQWGYIYGAQLTLRNATVAAARYAILTQPAPAAVNGVNNDSVELLARSSLSPTLDPQNSTATFTPAASVSCGTGCTVTAKQVSLSYNLALFFPIVVPSASGGVLTLNAMSVMR